MRTLARISFLAILVAGLASVAASTAATNATLRELPETYLLSGLRLPAPRMMGTLTPLQSGVTYQASQVPLALRVTPPGGGWTGSQWKSARLGFRGGGPPFFGWAAIGKGGSSHQAAPRGLIVIMTAYARTPSVAKTAKRLRTQGLWARYKATSPAKIAGFSGVQFDGQVVAPDGRNHVFAPFTDANHFQDAFYAGPSELFRVIVLNVRGKTVVIFIDSFALQPNEFPTFLAKANQVLKSLRFPRGG
jgi:hypothetical protein